MATSRQGAPAFSWQALREHRARYPTGFRPRANTEASLTPRPPLARAPDR